MNEDILLPIIASFLTLLVTKLFDAVMANRKNKMDSVIQSLSAIDEISTAASDTINYLRSERDALRKERDDYMILYEVCYAENKKYKEENEQYKGKLVADTSEIISLNERIEELLIEVKNQQENS